MLIIQNRIKLIFFVTFYNEKGEKNIYRLISNNFFEVKSVIVKPFEKPFNKYKQQQHTIGKNSKSVQERVPEEQESNQDNYWHYLLFTGHMIDKPEREIPRFPEKKENSVRQKLKEEIEKVKRNTTGKLKGIAGGACGGDILFHEICQELKISTELFLALPREKFLVESVVFAGHGWVERFDKLFEKLPVRVLSKSQELPEWLKRNKTLSIWERNNLWQLNCALKDGGLNMSLIALWDGKGGDGPGGTADMVKEAKAKGARTIIINPEEC
jgi:hypothetical protein